MSSGHRHVDLLDYTLAQVRAYVSAHAALDAERRALAMDAQRIAANADADAYTAARERILDVDGSRGERRQAADRAGMEQAFDLPAGWDRPDQDSGLSA